METKWNGFQTVITQRSNHNLSLLPHLISFENYKNRTNYNFLFPFEWKQTVHHIFTEIVFYIFVMHCWTAAHNNTFIVRAKS